MEIPQDIDAGSSVLPCLSRCDIHHSGLLVIGARAVELGIIVVMAGFILLYFMLARKYKDSGDPC